MADNINKKFHKTNKQKNILNISLKTFINVKIKLKMKPITT